MTSIRYLASFPIHESSMTFRILALSCLLYACSCAKDSTDPPPGASKSSQASGKEPAPAAGGAAEKRPLPAIVAAEKLEALLPASVGDWKRIELRSHVQKTADGDVVQSDAVFQLGEDVHWIHVSLLDSRGIESIHNMFHEMHDRPTEGITPFLFGGQPSLEQFSAKPLNTVLMTLVDERFFILVNGEGSDQPTVKKFLEAVDVKAVAALK